MIEHLVTAKNDYRSVCEKLSKLDRFGLDTEFIGEGRYRPTLCLVQVATDDALYALDPLALGSLAEFWEIVASGEQTVVVHAGQAESRLCYLAIGKPPGRLFDVQVAAGLVGLPYPLSYGVLVSEVLGEEVGQSATMTDWSKRPLSTPQLRYAFEDVRYLLRLHDVLCGRLRELGRERWAEEEFRRVAHRADEELDAGARGEPWRRLKGTRTLGPRQLAALKALYEWREEEAFRTNRSAKSICANHVLVELARQLPQNEQQVRAVRGVPRRYVDELYRVLKAAYALPPDALPEVIESDPPQVQLLVQFLQACLHTLAARMQLAPGLVASQPDIRRWLRRRLVLPSAETPSILEEGWRAEVILPVLEKCLRGEYWLGVGALEESVPLRLEATRR